MLLLHFQYTNTIYLAVSSYCSTLFRVLCAAFVGLLQRLRPNSSVSKGDSSTLPLRQRISSFAVSMLITERMRSWYDLSAVAALMTRLCCALKPLLCKWAGNRSSAETDRLPSLRPRSCYCAVVDSTTIYGALATLWKRRRSAVQWNTFLSVGSRSTKLLLF